MAEFRYPIVHCVLSPFLWKRQGEGLLEAEEDPLRQEVLVPQDQLATLVSTQAQE